MDNIKVHASMNSWGCLNASDNEDHSVFLQHGSDIQDFYAAITMPKYERDGAMLDIENGWTTSVMVDADYWHNITAHQAAI